MINIDTNVFSETMKPSPEAAVLDCLNEQQSFSLYLTKITIGEIG